MVGGMWAWRPRGVVLVSMQNFKYSAWCCDLKRPWRHRRALLKYGTALSGIRAEARGLGDALASWSRAGCWGVSVPDCCCDVRSPVVPASVGGIKDGGFCCDRVKGMSKDSVKGVMEKERGCSQTHGSQLGYWTQKMAWACSERRRAQHVQGCMETEPSDPWKDAECYGENGEL